MPLRSMLHGCRHTPPVSPALLDLGLWPLRFCRLKIALQLLLYLLADNAPSVPKAALICAINLASRGFSSWFGNVAHALRCLPVPIALDHWVFPTAVAITLCMNELESRLQQYLLQHITNAPKLVVWKSGIVPALTRAALMLAPILNARILVFISVIAHRRVMARLLAVSCTNMDWYLDMEEGPVTHRPVMTQQLQRQTDHHSGRAIPRSSVQSWCHSPRCQHPKSL